MSRPNAWHQAIVAQLSAAGGPLGVAQIWQRMEAAGFQHASKMPRSTLGARIAELVQMKWVERRGPATYALAPNVLPVDQSAPSAPSAQPPQSSEAST